MEVACVVVSVVGGEAAAGEEWVKQTDLRWNKGWLERHGPPGLDDHLRVLNRDLARNGCPTVWKTTDGSLLIDAPEWIPYHFIGDIIAYYGFTAVAHVDRNNDVISARSQYLR